MRSSELAGLPNRFGGLVERSDFAIPFSVESVLNAFALSRLPKIVGSDESVRCGGRSTAATSERPAMKRYGIHIMNRVGCSVNFT